MVDFEKAYGPTGTIATARTGLLARTYTRVYGWMALALGVSGAVAWYTAAWMSSDPARMELLLTGPLFYGLIIAELVLVFSLGAAVHKLPVAAALALFFGYAALNGVTLSCIFLVYSLGAITKVFFVTAGMFGGLALWGTFTREDLSSVGSFCGLALWGLVMASLVNLFARSSTLEWVCSIAGVVIFTGLAMYDAQKIRRLAAREGALEEGALARASILGALSLYLDFVNLFLHLLRLVGRER